MGKQYLALRVALRCSGSRHPPCLGIVFRRTLPVVVHQTKIVLRLRVALRSSGPTQPPCLGIVLRPALCIVMHRS
eukprot:scaffold16712_cov65-Phaeocystis_antarctica.AAC.6